MSLNQQQLQAARTLEGPLLILAGPGSGKTTTITERYKHLISTGLKPEEIMMVTFTRKAANEMKARIQKQMQNIDFHTGWVDTFHRICMDVLRKEGHQLGIPADFKICNNYESKKILDELIKKHNLSGATDEEEAAVTNTNTFEYISSLKTLLISPNALLKEMPTMEVMDWEKASAFIEGLRNEQPVVYEAIKVIYPEFQKELLTRKLLEFEDMLFYTVVLFEKRPDILRIYQDQIKYIQVDEFQDTNFVQLKLVQLLAGEKANICVVGDDAQSVYGFRGSEIDNILRFEQYFPGAKTIKLEQNYRSTKNIVDFSNAVIKYNKKQKHKTMFTEHQEGEKVQVIEAPTDEEEVKTIAKEIKQNIETGTYKWNDIAVLFRNNFHANKFAKIFAEEKIPFQITGDTEFADRAEVRDVLAYLRLLELPHDTFSLRRIINKPKRGIGPRAVSYIFDEIQGPIYDFLLNLNGNSHITKTNQKGIDELIHFFDACSSTLYEKGIGAAIEHLLKEIDYEKRVYEKGFSWMQEEVSEGLTELIRLAKKVEAEQGRMSVEQFQEYLREMYIDYENHAEKVTLMTVHKSKGLEYRIVFVTGLDNYTFPNVSKDAREIDIEEERRVFYVAVTRAKEKLYLSYPLMREKRLDGEMKNVETTKSQFLEEVWNLDMVKVIRHK